MNTAQTRLSDEAGPAESLERVVADTAHDYLNLLGVIINYTVMLARDCTDGNAATDLAEIHSAAQQCVALTRRLQAFVEPR